MLTIKAVLRINRKTAAVRRLRKTEKCPAIIYNTYGPNIIIELHNKDIQHPESIHHFYKDNVMQLIINQKNTITVKIQDIQYHPYKQKIIHIDFMIIPNISAS